MDAIEQFVQAIKEPGRDTITTYSAIVSRKDPDGKIWVKLSGAEDETPTASTSADVKRGDSVMVEWRNNKLYIAGNSSNPSVGVEQADQIRNLAYEATENASVARDAADTAEASAKEAQANAAVAKRTTDEINAYAQTAGKTVTQILNDGETAGTAAQEAKADAASAKASATTANTAANGALNSLSTVEDVIGVLDWASKNANYTKTQDTDIEPGKTYWTRSGAGTEQDPYTYTPVPNPIKADLGNYYEISGVDEAMADYINSHVALTNEGLYVMADSSEWKVLIKSDGVYVVDPQGNYASQFKSFAQLGLSNGAHSIIDANGQRFYASNGQTQLANIGYGEGASETGTATAPYYTFGFRPTGSTIGNWSYAEGRNAEASGVNSHAEGDGTEASGDYSHAEGRDTEASGNYSHAEGRDTTAYRNWSHAEGRDTTASGFNSHSEGRGTTAGGESSHAEGYNSSTSGSYSHAEGEESEASGRASHCEGISTSAGGHYSHSQNCNTIAQRKSQTAIGEYNVADTAGIDGTVRGDYSVIIGNGADVNNRSNALTVDWNGNVDIASGAKYKINGTALAASDVGAVPTTRTVNSNPLSSDITLTASDVGAEPTLTNISESGGTYSGGIEDEKLLTDDTLADLRTAGIVSGSDLSGSIDQTINYLANNAKIGDLIKVVHTSVAVSGTLSAHSGGSVQMTVTAPTGYSILAHITCWNTDVVGVVANFDSYTTSSSFYVYQNNTTTVSKSRGHVHVLTLCIKNM